MNHALQNEEPVELWHVEVAPNDVRVVTLEQLDEAFQKGLVNERTRVFQDGMEEPAFLGELLGLGDDDEEESEVQPAPVSTLGPSRHYQETLIGLTATPSTVPQRSAPPPQSVSRAPAPYAVPSRGPAPQAVPSRAPAPRGASAYPAAVQAAPAYRPQSAPPQAAATRRPPPPPEGAWPPVVARKAPPASHVARSVPPPPPVVVPSVVPLAMDLGDDLDFPQPKRRGKVLFLGTTVLAVAAGVALMVTGQGQSLLSSLTASASPPAPVKAAAPPPVFKSHALDVGEAPVKLKEAPPPVVITTCENEAQQLGTAAATAPSPESASKSTPTKSAPTRSVGARRAKGGGGGAPRGGGGAHSPKAPSMSGGSKYDPLNGSL